MSGHMQQIDVTYCAQTLEEITQAITAGQSFFLEGIPGSGRSSIMRFLASKEYLQKHYWPELVPWFIFLDFNTLTQINESTVYGYMNNELGGVFLEDVQSGVDAMHKIIRNKAKEGIKIVIILKQCELLLHMPDSFFRILNSWREGLWDMLVYVALAHNADDCINSSQFFLLDSAFKGKKIFVKPFDFSSLRTIIESWDVSHLHAAEYESIIVLSGGNPRLAKIVWQLFLAHNEFIDLTKEEIAKHEQVHTFLLHIIAYIEEKLKVEWHILLQDFDRYEDELIRMCVWKDDHWQIPLLGSVSIPQSEHLSIRNGALYKGQKFVENITAQEFEIMSFLLNHVNTVITRDELAAVLSPHTQGDGVSNDMIDQYISRIRKKIGDTHKNGILTTLHGRGYLLKG